MIVNLTPSEAVTISNAFAQLARVYSQIAQRNEQQPEAISDDLLFNVDGEALQEPTAAPVSADADDSNETRATRKYYGRVYRRDGFVTDNAAIHKFNCTQKELTRAMKAVKVERHFLNARGSHYFVRANDLPFVEAYFRMNK